MISIPRAPVFLVLALVATGVTQARPSVAVAEPLLVQIGDGSPDTDRGYGGIVFAALSRVPGIQLLEGLESDRIEAEKKLSASGLVSEDSRVKDRRVLPDVVVGVPKQAGKSRTLAVQAFGSATKVDVPLDLSIDDAGLARLVAAILAVAPEGKAAGLGGLCTADHPSPAAVASPLCVGILVARCRTAEGSASDVRLAACVAVAAEAVHGRVKDIGRDVTPFLVLSEADRALMARVRANDKTLASDKDALARLQALAVSGKPVIEAMGKAVESLKKNTVDALTGLVKLPQDWPGFQAGAAAPEFSVRRVVWTGFRWDRSDRHVHFLLDVTFVAKVLRETVDLGGGTFKTFDKRVSTFRMDLPGAGGQKGYESRLVVGESNCTGGTIQAAVRAEKFLGGTTWSFGDPVRLSRLVEGATGP